MTAAAWANVIAILAAFGALLGTLIGWLDNRRNIKQAETVSAQAQETSEAAAQSLERMAQALEATNVLRIKQAQDLEPTWSLKHVTGHLFMLENIGTGPGFEVMICPPNGAAFVEQTPLPVDKVKPKETVQFMCGLDFESGNEVTVTYSTTEGGERNKWVRPLPPITGN